MRHKKVTHHVRICIHIGRKVLCDDKPHNVGRKHHGAMVSIRLHHTFIKIILCHVAEFVLVKTGLHHLSKFGRNLQRIAHNLISERSTVFVHRQFLLRGRQLPIHNERDARVRALENLVIFLLLLGLLVRWNLFLHRLAKGFIHNVVNVETLHWGGFVKRQWKCVGMHLRLTRHGRLTQPIIDGRESEANECQQHDAIFFHKANLF